MFAKYYFNNPTHVTLPQSPRASCLGNRLARGAIASCCRSFVFVSFAWLRWCEYGAPARLADLPSWIFCFATTRWSVVTLDPGNKQMNNLYYYLLTRRSRVQVLSTRIKNNDTLDRRRIVNNMR